MSGLGASAFSLVSQPQQGHAPEMDASCTGRAVVRLALPPFHFQPESHLLPREHVRELPREAPRAGKANAQPCGWGWVYGETRALCGSRFEDRLVSCF